MPDTLDFLRLILPNEGWYCGCIKTTRGMHQFFAQTQEDLAQRLVHAASSGQDVYHACSTFTTSRSRKADNVHSIKSLWMDVDTRETHDESPYESPLEACHAVLAFCCEASLPTPTFVGSGGGLHLYWTLDVAVRRDTWLCYSHFLKRRSHSFGLHADPARTTDAASILRPPGTCNYKREPQLVECGPLEGPYPLSAFEHIKEGYGESTRAVAPRLGRIAAAASSIFGDEPSDALRVADQCRQLGALRESRGNLPEPLWYACLGVLAHCERGDELGHEWSSGYERYTRVETGHRLDRQREHGPTTCAHFQSLNPQGCRGCSFAEHISSPIQLGRTNNTH